MEKWDLRRLLFTERVRIRELARRFGLSRKTVRRALRSTDPPRYSRPAARRDLRLGCGERRERAAPRRLRVYAFAPIGPQRAPAQTEAGSLAFLDGYAHGLGASLAASRAQLLHMVAHRVALAGAGLFVRADQGDQRATRILDHAIEYAQWLEWYGTGGGAARCCAAMITDIAVRDAGSKGRGVFALRAFRKG